MKRLFTSVLCIIISATILTACEGNKDSNGQTSSEGEKIKDVSAKEIAEVISKSEEWPKLSAVSDNNELKEYMLIDADNEDFKEVYALKPGISGTISEIIVIKAKEGKAENAKKALEARKDKLINQDSFYPEHVKWAQNSVIETIGDYAFLICNRETDKAVKAVEDYLKH